MGLKVGGGFVVGFVVPLGWWSYAGGRSLEDLSVELMAGGDGVGSAKWREREIELSKRGKSRRVLAGGHESEK